MTWMQSYTGKAVDFLVPDPQQIDLADIAVSLGRCGRFNRMTQHHYSVAQHSIFVAQLVSQQRPGDTIACLWALLHDAHEAYTGDITTPMIKAIQALLPFGCENPVRVIQRRLDEVILQALDIDTRDITLDVMSAVAFADRVALATEREQMLSMKLDWGIPFEEPTSQPIYALSAASAEFVWRCEVERALEAYRKLKAARIAAE